MVNVKEIEYSEQQYKDLLNDSYPEVKIGNLVFSAGTIVKKCDPVAFRCGISDMGSRWECGECNKEYEEKDEAEECCKEEVA